MEDITGKMQPESSARFLIQVKSEPLECVVPWMKTEKKAYVVKKEEHSYDGSTDCMVNDVNLSVKQLNVKKEASETDDNYVNLNTVINIKHSVKSETIKEEYSLVKEEPETHTSDHYHPLDVGGDNVIQSDQRCSSNASKNGKSIYITHNEEDQKNEICSVKDGQNKCNSCVIKFESSSLLMNHLFTVHSAASGYVCDNCEKKFTFRNALVRHMKEQHYGTKKWVRAGRTKVQHNNLKSCPKCGRNFYTEYNFDRHMLSHELNVSNAMFCPVCQESRLTKYSLAIHLMSHYGNVIECFCKKLPSGLSQIHKPFCNGNAYECTFCKNCFERRDGLIHHLERHVDEKFKCSVCGKFYKDKYSFLGHWLNHTYMKNKNKSKNYKCKVCKKQFEKQSSFSEHFNIHTGIKSFICSICGKSFARKQHLKGHSFTHGGEKPYNCVNCGKSYIQKKYLIEHLQKCNGKKC